MKKFYILLSVILIWGEQSFSQYSPQYYQIDSVKETSGNAQTNYQALLVINTQALISSGYMQATGADIRFSSTCLGSNLDYYIESGINTSATYIWVRIPNIGAGAIEPVFMTYGDPSAIPASNFSNTFPNALIITTSTTLSGVQNYDWIEIGTGVTITVTPGTPLELNAERVIIATGAVINANGAGNIGGSTSSGAGAGGGTYSTNSGAGGGSYGGTGGTGGYDSGDTPGNGGPTYGTVAGPDIDMGSGGGGYTVVGGSGGGAVKIQAVSLDVLGTIQANGTDGLSSGQCSGGGSGGGIQLIAPFLVGNGNLFANGGTGGQGTSTANDSGGGGGGGRIKTTSLNTPMFTMNVTGGLGGPNGGAAPSTPGTAGTINNDISTPFALNVEGTHTNLPMVSASVLPSNSVTVGTNVTLYGNGANNYLWNGPQAISDNVPFLSTLAHTGIYTVTGTDAAGCSGTASLLLTVSAPSIQANALLWGTSPFQDSLWSFDISNAVVVDRIAPSLSGFTITGVNGLAMDPCTFKTYAILKVSGVSGRVLATIDLPTGVCSQVGNLGDNFSSISFRKDGQLFGVTGDGASVSESLYMIDKTTAVKTLVMALGNGADGEVICYNPGTDSIYHWSGNGTVVYERFSANATTYSPAAISGSLGSGEVFGAYCLDTSTFIVSTINSNFRTCSTDGVLGTSLLSTPDDIRGMVMLPTFEFDQDSVCQNTEPISVASDGTHWFTTYFAWGDGAMDTVIGNGYASHLYSSTGNKTISVILDNGTCSPDTFMTKTVFIKNTPAVALNGGPGFCAGDSVQLTGSSGGNSQWYLNGTAISGATSNTLWVSASGNYNMVKTNLNGCADSASSGIYAVQHLDPTVSLLNIVGSNCDSTEGIMVASGASSYTWATSPNMISTSVLDTLYFTADSAYTIIVTGTDMNGCTDTGSATVIYQPGSGVLATSTSTHIQYHADALPIEYNNLNCDLIATVSDLNGGNILGTTEATVNVLPTSTTFNGQNYVRRYYTITPASDGPAQITIYANQSDFTDYNAVVGAPTLPLPTTGSNSDPNIPNIRVTKHSTLHPVEVISPVTNWNGAYWELSFPVTGFSTFRIHGVNPFNAALPVELADFRGRREEAMHILEWNTWNEHNNSHFEIERSGDGEHYYSVGSLYSKALNGNSNRELTYLFKDVNPLLGKNYYRLRIVDIDGKYSYSDAILLNFEYELSVVRLFPNPLGEELNVDIYCRNDIQSLISIKDIRGKVVLEKKMKLNTGNNPLKMNVSGLANGLYFVEVFENGSRIFTEKIMKK